MKYKGPCVSFLSMLSFPSLPCRADIIIHFIIIKQAANKGKFNSFLVIQVWNTFSFISLFYENNLFMIFFSRKGAKKKSFLSSFFSLQNTKHLSGLVELKERRANRQIKRYIFFIFMLFDEV